MNIKEVKDLIQEVLQSDISEFELEHTGTKIRLRRGFSAGNPAPMLPVQTFSPPVAAPAPVLQQPLPSAAPAAAAEAREAAEEQDLHFITSPIVGTFYRAPSPGAEPYVKVGGLVEEGTVLCIVEAMKLMNEIPSDVSGEIVRIYVENGQPIEFGQRLFGIRPRR